MRGKNPSLCDRAVEYVLTRKVDDLGELTVAKVARSLEVSQSYLTRLFRLQRDFTLRDYLLREKMFRSALLLVSEPDLTIKQLSERMGFMDSEYFAGVFRNYFGISPGKYRKCKEEFRAPG